MNRVFRTKVFEVVTLSFRRCYSVEKNYSVCYPGKKVDVKGQTIHYEEVGNGPQTVLLMPGALGSSRSDFRPQLENLNREKYTLIAWDPPGYGYSRPPDRVFDQDFYYKDADKANDLMLHCIKQPKYSVIGWSDGGITGLIMAGRFSDNVQKLAVFGSSAFITEKDVQLVSATRDIANWSERMKTPLIQLYGEQYFKSMWEGFCDIYSSIQKTKGGDICMEELSKISCPTLVIHGDKDPMVDPIHPEFLVERIQNSRLIRFPNGKHNLHLRYPEEFNKAIEIFLDEEKV